jgi:hypothetical protein
VSGWSALRPRYWAIMGVWADKSSCAGGERFSGFEIKALATVEVVVA